MLTQRKQTMISVTITANDDGSYTVEQEGQDMATEAPEAPENGAQDMAEDQSEGEPSQQFSDLKEAVMAAAQMLSKAPQMDGEDQLKQGFASVRGSGK